MKKLLLTIAFVFLTVISYSQSYRYFYAPAETSKAESDSFKKAGIRSMKELRYEMEKKGTTVRVRKEKKFDENGRMTESVIYKNDRKNRVSSTCKYSYSDAGYLLTFVRTDSKGKETFKELYTHEKDSLIKERVSIWNSGKSKSRLVYMYNEKGICTEALVYKAKGTAEKLVSKTVYEYYPDGSRKSIMQYNGKGKLKHTWSYDCSRVGVLKGSKQEDTTTQCSHSEYDAEGNRLEVSETIDEKGRMSRRISRYDKENHLVSWEALDHKNRRRTYLKYTYTNGKYVGTEYNFYRKGKLVSSTRYEYEHYTNFNFYRSVTITDLLEKDDETDKIVWLYERVGE